MHIILRDIKIRGFNGKVLNDNDLIIIGHWQTTPFECYGTTIRYQPYRRYFCFPPRPFSIFFSSFSFPLHVSPLILFGGAGGIPSPPNSL